jgi:phosphoribosylformylglycinamidine synthase
LKVENNKSIFTYKYDIKEDVEFPIAHGEGNYFCSEETRSELIGNNQILFTYNENPNGSINDIAGIQNLQRNVMGMMPHPERASDSRVGKTDGLRLLQGIVESVI